MPIITIYGVVAVAGGLDVVPVKEVHQVVTR